MSGGSLRRRSVGGACDHEDHSGRVCSPSAPSLSERTPPYGILHTAMVLKLREDLIGQAVRNSERFAKQKDKQQGGRRRCIQNKRKNPFQRIGPKRILNATRLREVNTWKYWY